MELFFIICHPPRMFIKHIIAYMSEDVKIQQKIKTCHTSAAGLLHEAD